MSASNGLMGLSTLEEKPGALSQLYAAIGLATVAFPDLPRTATGQVGKDRKFKYAPYHKVVKCIRVPLATQGVTFMQPLHTEVDGKVSVTLLVTGFGALIASTLKFTQDEDPKIFGANATYYKRYQLTNFFGLEGDPDADDFDDVDVATQAAISKTIQSKPGTAAPTKVEAVVTANEQNVAKAEVAKPAEERPAKVEETVNAKAIAKDTRSIGDKLTDAMKQLNWKMPDFDTFCKEYPEDFPGYISASKLPADGKIKLYEMLVLKRGVAPWGL